MKALRLARIEHCSGTVVTLLLHSLPFFFFRENKEVCKRIKQKEGIPEIQKIHKGDRFGGAVKGKWPLKSMIVPVILFLITPAVTTFRPGCPGHIQLLWKKLTAGVMRKRISNGYPARNSL